MELSTLFVNPYLRKCFKEIVRREKHIFFPILVLLVSSESFTFLYLLSIGNCCFDIVYCCLIYVQFCTFLARLRFGSLLSFVLLVLISTIGSSFGGIFRDVSICVVFFTPTVAFGQYLLRRMNMHIKIMSIILKDPQIRIYSSSKIVPRNLIHVINFE